MPILRSLWNTFIVTFFGVAIQVIVGALAAYGMILRKSRFTAAVGAVLMVAFVVPAQSTLIPLYRMEAQSHLVNTLAGLVVIYLGGAIFCYFLIVGYMRSLPFELIEAARIDGAGPLQIFFRIIMPLAKSALVVVALFTFLGNWNDFFGPIIYLNTKTKFTLAVGLLQFRGDYSTKWNLLMAASTIVVAPCVGVFLVGQKHLIEGISLTGMKA